MQRLSAASRALCTVSVCRVQAGLAFLVERAEHEGKRMIHRDVRDIKEDHDA
jgi:hypothetical protein